MLRSNEIFAIFRPWELGCAFFLFVETTALLYMYEVYSPWEALLVDWYGMSASNTPKLLLPSTSFLYDYW